MKAPSRPLLLTPHLLLNLPLKPQSKKKIKMKKKRNSLVSLSNTQKDFLFHNPVADGVSLPSARPRPKNHAHFGSVTASATFPKSTLISISPVADDVSLPSARPLPKNHAHFGSVTASATFPKTALISKPPQPILASVRSRTARERLRYFPPQRRNRGAPPGRLQESDRSREHESV